MSIVSTALKIIVPIGIVVGGAAGMMALAQMRKAPPRKPPETVRMPVDTVSLSAADGPAVVKALGKVIPAREVNLQAEVTGRIVQLDEQFVAGGRIAEGTTLVRLDDRDYRLAIQQAQANVKRAEVSLQTEKSRKAVAEREWKLIGDQSKATDRGRALALREPQLAGAEADVDAARSGLRQARLSLQRTQIAAPFNAVVRAESVDVGQIARPGSPLGTLIGTDSWWVQASLPASELKWVQIPGSAATIVQQLGDGSAIRREGTVVRLLPDVDPAGLMARVIIEVADPMALEDGAKGALLLGGTVQVELAGQPVSDVVAVPRRALRDNDTVWIVGEGATLSVVEVEVIRRERDRVLVRGLPSAAEVIANRIPAPVPGMAIAPPGYQPAGAKSDATAKPAAADKGQAK